MLFRSRNVEPRRLRDFYIRKSHLKFAAAHVLRLLRRRTGGLASTRSNFYGVGVLKRINTNSTTVKFSSLQKIKMPVSFEAEEVSKKFLASGAFYSFISQ